MIIDSHIHLPTTSKQAFEKGYKELEQEMDELGIDYAVVMSVFCDKYDPERDSDVLHEGCAKYNRIFPIECFDMDFYDKSMNRVMEAVDKKAVVAVKFFTGYQPFFPTSEKISPVLEKCEKKDIAAIFHTGATSRSEKALMRYCSDPFTLDEVAHKYPELNVVAAHCNSPNFIHISPILENNHNLYADLSGLFCGDLKNNSYIPNLSRLLDDGLSYMEDTEKKVMFGSDKPYCNLKDHFAFIQRFFERYDYSDHEIKNIMGETAKKCYKLDIK